MNEKYNSQELVEKIKFRWTKGKEIISNNTTKNSKKLNSDGPKERKLFLIILPKTVKNWGKPENRQLPAKIKN